MIITDYHRFAQAVVNEGQLRQDIPTVSLTSGTFDNALALIFAFAGGIALVVVTYGGVKYVLASDNPQKTSEALKTIIYGLVGMAVVITAGGLVALANRLVSGG